MKFQINDRVLYDGQICRVTYANDEIVVFQRMNDAHLMTRPPFLLAAEQVPWINTGKGWWSQMRDVPEYRAVTNGERGP